MKLTKTRTANADCTRLAPQVTVDAQAYTSLPVHEQTRLRCLAAALSAHRAVLAACSAARVHRLWVLSARGEEDIELALAGGTAPPNAQVPPGWRYHKMKLPPGDIVSVSVSVSVSASAEEGAPSVRATSPARTVVDLARLHGFVRGLVAADSYLARGYERAALEAVARRLRGTRGIGQARQVIEAAIGVSESPYESLARGLLIHSGLAQRHRVEPQARIGAFRVDLLIDGWLALEVDGASKYDGQTYGRAVEDVIRSERDREVYLQNQGFVVRRVTPRQLFSGYAEFMEMLTTTLRRARR
ncbi:hypothetical protein [Corynebacterium sp. HMSC04H06]|uniref:hypothetical protein n=1 Tax=Corynebacterium sp. HMSC04H06 TaxID=1581050 RepID=UPI0008A59B5D|nr:hypothetical protein [Corynebacterium sp. HMSC04H06]OFS22435.1 hypothetical protein HMPREF3067_03660 [Corynebacterium sp. HMSC04H06]